LKIVIHIRPDHYDFQIACCSIFPKYPKSENSDMTENICFLVPRFWMCGSPSGCLKVIGMSRWYTETSPMYEYKHCHQDNARTLALLQSHWRTVPTWPMCVGLVAGTGSECRTSPEKPLKWTKQRNHTEKYNWTDNWTDNTLETSTPSLTRCHNMCVPITGVVQSRIETHQPLIVEATHRLCPYHMMVCHANNTVTHSALAQAPQSLATAWVVSPSSFQR
jgi:hypothetical protein